MKEDCINFIEFSNPDIWAVFASGGGTWFIAAVIGSVWWVRSLAQYLSPHFPQLGKGHRVPCRLFYTGVRFLQR